MQVTIRLGYPYTFSDTQGLCKYAGWFWGQRGKQSGYTNWTDEKYEYAKSLGFENIDTEGWWFHPEESLSFGHERTCFEQDTYTNYIENRKSFLVPLDIKALNPEDLDYLRQVKFPEDLLSYILKGKAKVLFFSHEEGVTSKEHFDRMQDFCRNNGLTAKEVYFSSTNLDTSKLPRFEDRLFSIRTFCFFGEELWFFDKSKVWFAEEDLKKVECYREDNRNPKQYTFLCLNRRPDWQRTFLAGFLQEHPEVKGKAQVSLGIGYLNQRSEYTGQAHLCDLENFSNQDLKYLDMVRKYYLDRYSENVLQSPDESDPRILQNRVDFAEKLYRNSFCTIVTETYFWTNKVNPRAFFSEKVFKPVFALQPFILVGTRGLLQKFRELGYQTFDRWWDESYDTLEDDLDRLNAICDQIVYLAGKSDKELRDMTLDMESVLVHNWNRLMSDKDIRETMTWLENLV